MPPKKAAVRASTLAKSQVVQNVEKQVAARLEEARARLQGDSKARATPITAKSTTLSSAAKPTAAVVATATPAAKEKRERPILVDAGTSSVARTKPTSRTTTVPSSTKPAASATSRQFRLRAPSLAGNSTNKYVAPSIA
jgi:Xaa-Pro aminopeptidase